MDDEKKGLIKMGLIILTLIYIISPVDLMPGMPIDDIMVLLLQIFIQNRLSQKKDMNTVTNPITETYNTYTEDIIDSNEV